MRRAPPPAAMSGDVYAAVRALVDEYRTRCLWFLKTDHYPENAEEALRALGYIERYGDRAATVRAGEIRQWLLQHSSEPFAAC